MGVLSIGQIDVETRLAVDWRDTYQRRLVTAEEALKSIRPKDRVVIPIGCNPQLLGDTLAARMDDLEGVELAHTAAGWPYLWLQPGMEGPFTVVHEHWASPLGWDAMKGRHHDFYPPPSLYVLREPRTAVPYRKAGRPTWCWSRLRRRTEMEW